jgi:DNA-binding CsgD family transcriptional regulator
MPEFAGGASAVSPDPGRSNHGPTSDQRASAVTVGRPPVGHRLLEREDEVRELEMALDEVEAGTGQVVVLEAPAGLGKTSLLELCRGSALERGFAVVIGRASEFERGFPFGVVVQLFEQRLVTASEEERCRLMSGAAALCAPLLAAGDAIGQAGPSSQGQVSHAALHGLYWLCANLAAEAPLLVIVDDVHWADVPSRRFLSYMLRRLDGVPVLMALALRPDEAQTDVELVQEIIRNPGARLLHPGPLSDAAISALVSDALVEPPTDQFVRACAEVTLGNPMLLRELLVELAIRGVPTSDAGIPDVRRVAPANIARMVRQRLARLPEPAQALARAAAVLGERADLRHVAALCRLETSEAVDAADALTRVEIMRPGRPLSFVHPIVRAAIYSEMPTVERAAQHARAARLLDADRSPSDQVAAHLMLTLAANDAWVVEALRSAAERALARGTPAAAIDYLRRALEEPPGAGALAEIMAELGAAESRAGDARAIDDLERALELTHAPDRRATIALELGRALTMAGRPLDTIDLLTKTSAALGDQEADLALRLESELLEAARLSVGTRPLIADRLQSLRTRMRGRRPAERVLGSQLAYEAVIQGESAPHAAELATTALGAGALLREEGCESHTYYYAVWTLALCDHLREAADALDAAIADARAHGSALGYGVASCFRSNVHYRAGMLIDAEADARAALRVARLQDLGPSLPLATAFLTDALIDQGKLDEASEILAAVESAIENADSIAANPLLFSRGRLRLSRGQTEAGLADLLEVGRRGAAWGARTPAFLPWRSTAATALSRLGRAEEAAAFAEEELALARAFGAPRALAIALCAAGQLARGQRAIDRLSEASSVLEGSPAQLERARVLVEYGAALRRANRRKAAKAQLRDGLLLAERCGATTIAEHARVELAATGARPRRAEYRHALTPSERRVAQMAATGLGNREIAQALFVTEKTVEWHLSQAYRKLDVHSRHDLSRALGDADTLAPDS